MKHIILTVKAHGIAAIAKGFGDDVAIAHRSVERGAESSCSFVAYRVRGSHDSRDAVRQRRRLGQGEARIENNQFYPASSKKPSKCVGGDNSMFAVIASHYDPIGCAMSTEVDDGRFLGTYMSHQIVRLDRVFCSQNQFLASVGRSRARKATASVSGRRRLGHNAVFDNLGTQPLATTDRPMNIRAPVGRKADGRHLGRKFWRLNSYDWIASSRCPHHFVSAASHPHGCIARLPLSCR